MIDTARGRRFVRLSAAILAGLERRPTQARGDYLDRNGGASALMTAAEGAAKTVVNAKRPAEVLGALRAFPLLQVVVACPACGVHTSVARVVELHLNDEHQWTRYSIAAWVAKLERAEAALLKDPGRGLARWERVRDGNGTPR